MITKYMWIWLIWSIVHIVSIYRCLEELVVTSTLNKGYISNILFSSLTVPYLKRLFNPQWWCLKNVYTQLQSNHCRNRYDVLPSKNGEFFKFSNLLGKTSYLFLQWFDCSCIDCTSHVFCKHKCNGDHCKSRCGISA